MIKENGIIIKGIGGFYYVKTADGIFECRAKGIFRKRGITPLAGDNVEIERDEESATVSEIYPRRNSFFRPPIANVDNLILVVSTVDPAPNLLVIDKLTALSEKQGVKPTLLLTKSDLERGDGFCDIYLNAGFSVLRKDCCEDMQRLKGLLRQGLSVVVGNSGVGKSTLLNEILPDISLETGETSKKLGRGRHTTRAVELYEFGGGYVADTPGFSAVDFEGLGSVKKEELASLFPDLSEFTDGCYFTGCSHTVEKGCAVLRALSEGKIEKTRHESYKALYKELNEKNEWK